MDVEKLKNLATTVAAHFAATQVERDNTREASKERVGLILASIKATATGMSEGDKVNTAYAFGIECRKAGMADSTIAARRSEFLMLLDNPDLIPDAADTWRPTVDGIRLAKLGAEKALRLAIVKAEKALAEADTKLQALQNELAGLIGCKEAGLI